MEPTQQPVRDGHHARHAAIPVPAFLRVLDDMLDDATLLVEVEDKDPTELRIILRAVL